MSDRYDADTLLGYLEGDLPQEEQARFEALLAQDAQLRRLVSQLQEDRSILRSLPQEDPPAHLLEGVIHHLERRMLLGPGADGLDHADRLRQRRHFRLYKTLAYGGIAAVLLLCGGVVFKTLMETRPLDEAADYALLARRYSAKEAAPAGKAEAGRRGADRKALAKAEDQNQDQAAGPSAPPAPGPAVASTPRVADASEPVSQQEQPTASPASPLAAAMAQAEVAEPQQAPSSAARDADSAGSDEPSGLRLGGSAIAKLDERAADVALRVDSQLSQESLPSSTQPAVAVMSAAPVLIEVTAADAEAAQQSLDRWARDNSVAIVAIASHAPTESGQRGQTAEQATAMLSVGSASAASPRSAGRRVVQMQVDAEQVPQLIAYLNRQPQRQRARLVQADEGHVAQANQAAEDHPADGLHLFAEDQAVEDRAIAATQPQPASFFEKPARTLLAPVEEGPARESEARSADAQASAAASGAVTQAAQVRPTAPAADDEPQQAAARSTEAVDQQALAAGEGEAEDAAADAGKNAEEKAGSLDWLALLEPQLPLVPTKPLAAQLPQPSSPARVTVRVVILEGPSLEGPGLQSESAADVPATQPESSPAPAATAPTEQASPADPDLP
ncbi:MAG TPA: hypothetical protein VF184_05910 [Phycisphaeraceae bacterium]